MINKTIFDQLTENDKAELKEILKGYGNLLKEYSKITEELNALTARRNELSEQITGLRARERSFIESLQSRPDFDTNLLLEELIKNQNNNVDAGTIING